MSLTKDNVIILDEDKLSEDITKSVKDSLTKLNNRIIDVNNDNFRIEQRKAVLKREIETIEGMSETQKKSKEGMLKSKNDEIKRLNIEENNNKFLLDTMYDKRRRLISRASEDDEVSVRMGKIVDKDSKEEVLLEALRMLVNPGNNPVMSTQEDIDEVLKVFLQSNKR